jgi:hypothetical protein
MRLRSCSRYSRCSGLPCAPWCSRCCIWSSRKRFSRHFGSMIAFGSDIDPGVAPNHPCERRGGPGQPYLASWRFPSARSTSRPPNSRNVTAVVVSGTGAASVHRSPILAVWLSISAPSCSRDDRFRLFRRPSDPRGLAFRRRQADAQRLRVWDHPLGNDPGSDRTKSVLALVPSQSQPKAGNTASGRTNSPVPERRWQRRTRRCASRPPQRPGACRDARSRRRRRRL